MKEIDIPAIDCTPPTLSHGSFRPRAMGALAGLILGDCIGAYFEFSARGRKEIPLLAELVQKTNVFGIRFGYTDDSILALLGLESLVACGGRWHTVSQRDFARRYLEETTAWSPNGRCFDIGTSTLRSLRDGDWPGKRDAARAGNGVLMKLAPYAIARCLHPEQEALTYYRQLADLTHGAPRTVATAQQMGLLLERLLQGVPWQDAHDGLDTGCRHEPISVARDYRGFCEDSWVLAQQLVQRRFRDGLDWRRGLQCIMDLGGDTDTNAAIYGQLYGAAFPVEVLEQFDDVRPHIHRAEAIEDLLLCLLRT